MQVETYLCLLCSVRKIHFGFPPPATTTYIFLRPRISLTRGQKKDTMLKILRTNFGHGLLNKFAFWLKVPKIDRPGSQDFQHLANSSLIHMGVLRFMRSPDCKDIKIAMWEVNFRGT